MHPHLFQKEIGFREKKRATWRILGNWLEDERYSIFAVTPVLASSDPTAPQSGTLIPCEADEQAQYQNPFLYSPPAGSSPASSTTNQRQHQMKICWMMNNQDRELG
ncbi:uncharacterized protein MELLADRAFT_108887 [Melampsora larici-populina 98AG31]|uniref:Uncharacterized protein n=1 Tax=Melampsora larici-populina (strain 98AG31 / pathotype 3-4-7) TaxID=747676 RepID=F4RUM2_MELLP|nr:uncharacterized protein MELLADRAFT_108887 [Melampsora larici-populina 98AG31]EGG03956.1 hypothetical protein MELLADRAFT_108887 [Melampsora larici-populina 98AG31]